MQVLHAVTRPGDRIVFSEPTFDGYPIFAQMARLTDWSPSRSTSTAITTWRQWPRRWRKPGWSYYADPTYPTGTLESAADVQRFLRRVPDDTVVLLDEAYIEFVAPQHRIDGPDLVRQFPNVIVLRTFSKAYGLAGLPDRVRFRLARFWPRYCGRCNCRLAWASPTWSTVSAS